MTEQKLIIGYQTALDFWRAARAASSDLQEPEAVGRTYGRLPQDVGSRAARHRAAWRRRPDRRCCPQEVRAGKEPARDPSFLLRTHVFPQPLLYR